MERCLEKVKVSLPTAHNGYKERMAENFDIFGFDLDPSDMEAILWIRSKASSSIIEIRPW
jgi:diketogulonate reductase-like aldo/keto reductase